MDDGDRFVVTAADAAGKLADAGVEEARRKAVAGQVAQLMERLADWADRRADRIDTLHLTTGPAAQLLFVVVQRNFAFDGALTEELLDLDVEIAGDEDCSQLRLSVLPLPRTSTDGLMAFVDPSFVLTHVPEPAADAE